MIRYAIDNGVNYLDTGYEYHGGNSERLLGKALKGGYRERVRLATKLPPWHVEGAQDFDRLLNEQMERLQTDHIDFYLLHGMNHNRWPKLRDLNVKEKPASNAVTARPSVPTSYPSETRNPFSHGQRRKNLGGGS
jgi:predicted aldo/keto reductase-like oxidoreductase